MYHVVLLTGKYSNHSAIIIKDNRGNTIKTWMLKNIPEKRLREIAESIKVAIDYATSRDASLEEMLEMASLGVRMI